MCSVAANKKINDRKYMDDDNLQLGVALKWASGYLV